MRESRNPFRLRRAENIDTDTVFLSLFEPGILEALVESGLPETVQPIRSAAGGGKTSLLRLFTPSVLLRLYARRTDEQVKELFGRLEALQVFDRRGPRLLGVLMLCGRNYAALQDLSVQQTTRTRLFFSLLNARIVLAVLRSALALKGREYPQDLNRIRIETHPAEGLPLDVPLPTSGHVLNECALIVERSICTALDSFGPLKIDTLPGHDTLFALSIIRPDTLFVDGEQIADHVILMMDDIHMLSGQQRSLLFERVIEARSRIGIWIAERFEALSPEEMLASGSAIGRDHEQPIDLERYWRARHERFEKHVMRVADRRVRASTDTELEGFRACLEDSLDGTEYEGTFRGAIGDIRARIDKRIGRTERFREWIDRTEKAQGTLRHLANAWRSLEILIERELNRRQKGLFDEVAALEASVLQEKEDSRIKQAAELFLAREYSLPYYFGPERLARLASLNIQQFLGLGGTTFEEVLAAELLRGASQVLSARRQHALMKKVAQAFWNDIPNNIRHGRDLRMFLESVGKYSANYTYRVTAPNDPGVGGTAIRMSEREQLLDPKVLSRKPERQRFAHLLASALAHNYLVADLDYKCKGDRWMVLNLNRLLCVYFDLPLGYGLYKERPLDELCRWVDEPYVAPRRQEALL